MKKEGVLTDFRISETLVLEPALVSVENTELGKFKVNVKGFVSKSNDVELLNEWTKALRSLGKISVSSKYLNELFGINELLVTEWQMGTIKKNLGLISIEIDLI